MSEIKNKKEYDLEKRTQEFAARCRKFVKNLPKTVGNFEDSKQLVRASGSVAANYIEANEAISKKDFLHRIKICRKESKESGLWIELCDIDNNSELNTERQYLFQEATEFRKIFGSIITKSETQKV